MNIIEHGLARKAHAMLFGREPYFPMHGPTDRTSTQTRAKQDRSKYLPSGLNRNKMAGRLRKFREFMQAE